MVYIGLCTRLSRSHYGYLLLSIHNEMEVLCLLPLNLPRNLYFYSWGNRDAEKVSILFKVSQFESEKQDPHLPCYWKEPVVSGLALSMRTSG